MNFIFLKKIFVKIIINRQKIIIGFIRISLAIAIFGSIYELNWFSLFISTLTLVLSFFPEFFHRQYRISLPNFLQIFIVIFVYASLFLGEARNFYIKFWWWDSLLHFLSGIALGFAGFLIIYILYKTGRIHASPAILMILSFCFVLAIGALWEIFEFLMDQFLNLDMQKSRNLYEISNNQMDTRLGVINTMQDLILDALGGLIASLVGFLFLKKKTPTFLKKIINEFEKKNQDLFIKK